MKLYTRGGDEGRTGLFGGDRVSKSHPRLAAVGSLDELNAALGVLGTLAGEAAGSRPQLQRIQRDLFLLGAILATPASRTAQLEERVTTPLWEIPDMEADIDRLSALAPPLQAFILPGGIPAAAWTHWARTVCRRAERLVVALHEKDPVDSRVVVYLNRLGDWLFALARAENACAGQADPEWRP